MYRGMLAHGEEAVVVRARSFVLFFSLKVDCSAAPVAEEHVWRFAQLVITTVDDECVLLLVL